MFVHYGFDTFNNAKNIVYKILFIPTAAEDEIHHVLIYHRSM